MTDFTNIFNAVSKISRGKVATYKQIAKITGVKNPRYVGFAIHRNTNIVKVPCHRVVKSDGKLATGYAHGGMKKQKEMLEKEGIKFEKGKIDLKKFLYSL
ncbi:MAG: MGMT family protein [Candidatus Levybacteria bacterium]|nr:MGMT family protein [Candidatus Levybacteria bacterium]